MGTFLLSGFHDGFQCNAIEREGKDVTITAFSKMVGYALQDVTLRYCPRKESVLSMSVVEESFEYLDAPIERIAGADVPMPYAANLERLAISQVLQHLFLFDPFYGLNFQVVVVLHGC
ncbi:pyruvate dehydrogenase E1 component subunit beta-1, mitochondrial [Hordeum vulgare]|nr:pyruvate dehydrogenase E1 component subunit beta-1, mitochondrial [Hordeum vulgare]